MKSLQASARPLGRGVHLRAVDFDMSMQVEGSDSERKWRYNDGRMTLSDAR